MKKLAAYMKWVSVLASLLLIISCFMPWAFYADLDKSFTGFFTENNVYGKPGKFLTVMALLSLCIQWLPNIFFKRVNLLLMALNMAYAVKSYIIFAACYGVVCPQKQAGLYLMVFSACLLLVAAFFPTGTVKSLSPENQGNSPAPDENKPG